MARPDDTSRESGAGGMAGTDVAALLFTAAWLGLTVWLAATSLRPAPDDHVGIALTLFGIVMPVALIWVAAGTARVARAMRLESARLRAEMDLLRRSGQMPLAAHQVHAADLPGRNVQDLARHPADPPPYVADAAPDAERRDASGLPIGILLRALDFPKSQDDREGFALLRTAMADAPTAQLVTATQNVLTLLREDGVRVKSLTLQEIDPAAWRAFAVGRRGPEVDAVGAIRDQDVLEVTDLRLHGDPVFRNAAHHFLRHFDRFLFGFVADATDDDIRALADSRTGRAFMLVGGAIGVFD